MTERKEPPGTAGREPRSDDDRRILEERARRLARPVRPPDRGAHEAFVAFRLAGERYAIEAAFVHAVFPLHEFSPLPGAAPPAFGVTVWRGDLLLILDLRRLLDVPDRALTDLSRVIVLGERQPAFGVLADAVDSLVSIPTGGLREPPPGVAPRRDHVVGIAPDATVVLDAGRILRLHG